MKVLGCLSLLLIMLAAGTAAAQSGPTGLLNGRVTDQSEGAIPGVAVVAVNLATNDSRTAVTNEKGLYQLSALAVGAYELTFKLDGFKSVRRNDVLVEAAVPRTIDVQLEVGGLAELVTVSGEVEILQNTNPTVARRLSSEEITSVPSSTRSFTHLLTATAGVSADLPPVGSNDTGAISPSVNGTKQTSNSVLYNGIDITSMLSNTGTLDEGLSPAPETIEEVKLQTSLYDAATGRSGGGNFQLVTKGGANGLNGSFYVFGQHERFNSNDFFFDKNGIDKPKMRRVESGFTLGGPLRRDRAFFFTSLQHTNAETGYVPTASSRAVLPDPSTLASPFPLRKNNRGQVASVSDMHIFGNNLLNEARVGLFTLRNTRRLDDDINGVTSAQFGIINPALLFDDSDSTRRLGHLSTAASPGPSAPRTMRSIAASSKRSTFLMRSAQHGAITASGSAATSSCTT